MRMKILVVAAALFAAACGGAAGANKADANNSNAKNTNASTASTTASPSLPRKNLPPTTMSVYEFMRAYNREDAGRTVTVTGGLLDEIAYTHLLIRDGSGYAFQCGGSFSDYMDMKTRIDDLRYKHRSPVATVKGTYTEGTSGRPALNNCVLTDLAK